MEGSTCKEQEQYVQILSGASSVHRIGDLGCGAGRLMPPFGLLAPLWERHLRSPAGLLARFLPFPLNVGAPPRAIRGLSRVLR